MATRFTTLFHQAVYLLAFLLTVGDLLPGVAQTKPVTNDQVTNIRLTAIGQTSLEILYDLAVSHPGDSIYFTVTGRKSGNLSYSPGFVEGDFGRHVVAGNNRRIAWNVLANGYELNEDIQVRVLVKPGPPLSPSGDSMTKSAAGSAPPGTTVPERVARPYRPGGPPTALLSVLVPGLGNVFVQNPRPRLGLRPLLAIGVAGAIAYGFNQHSQAQGQYRLYEQQKNPAQGEPYYQQANQSQHRYYLATRAAAAVWLGDVIFTLIRGIQNQKLRRESRPVSLRPGYQASTPVAAFILRF